ncbi:hypothetical protein DITRI_Ditri14bG0144300 [Diplodiscus trichospermus]
MAPFPSCNWSDLPKELLACIATRLDTRIDVLHFRAVCNSWRCSVPVPPKSPTLPIEFCFLVDHPNKPLASFLISQTTVYHIAPGFPTRSNNKSWFIKLEETKQDNKFRVLNPFSHRPIKNMPASLPKELNHLNFRVVETERAFSIRQIRDDSDAELNDGNPLVRKIKLASNFDLTYMVAAIKNGDLCRMRVDNDIQWCLLDSDVYYRDIANFEGKFFTVDLYGVILGLNENCFSLDEMHPPMDQKVWEAERYFLESCGHLHLVVRDFYSCPCQVHYDSRIDGFVKETGYENLHVPAKFKVYKRIPNDHRQNKYEWVEVNDLGDRVFFVSTDCSFSFSTRNYDGFWGNCIVYVDELDSIQYPSDEESDEEDDDNDGVWQLRKGKVGFFDLRDRSSLPLAFFPQYAALFWPPPTWLKWDQCSSSS